ncbi:hypothetical protein HO173_011451 [Letharia columbiana]|uniref:BTB domain-containing protein n=1 Tax=Letharia columbiana TaxID=112416 RepID=A0A8H6FJE0_9LECA|nr:uncharacterized protein HO173_011451 [Letharia columbiana]KAF6229596.1 hypothetical protein HO173_011451 [Letharia columbiana]
MIALSTSTSDQHQSDSGIHKALLSHRSSYFKAALTGGFRGSQTGVIDSVDEDPEVFRVFNEWLYLGAVSYQHQGTHHETWSALLNLYVSEEEESYTEVSECGH